MLFAISVRQAILNGFIVYSKLVACKWANAIEILHLDCALQRWQRADWAIVLGPIKLINNTKVAMTNWNCAKQSLGERKERKRLWLMCLRQSDYGILFGITVKNKGKFIKKNILSLSLLSAAFNANDSKGENKTITENDSYTLYVGYFVCITGDHTPPECIVVQLPFVWIIHSISYIFQLTLSYERYSHPDNGMWDVLCNCIYVSVRAFFFCLFFIYFFVSVFIMWKCWCLLFHFHFCGCLLVWP